MECGFDWVSWKQKQCLMRVYAVKKVAAGEQSYVDVASRRLVWEIASIP